MREVAIIGAGELGGAVAHALARRDIARSIVIVDGTGHVAAGKALDIAQAAPVEGFSTRLTGIADTSAASGADVIVIADRARGGEWQGDDAVQMLRPLSGSSQSSAAPVIVCAGASHRDLVDRAVRDLRIARTRVFGSATDALTAAARALVALEGNTSARDVSLAVVGIPPQQCVILWEDATIAGLAATRVLSEPVRRRLENRIAALWPPGPYALAAAAVGAIAALSGQSRQITCCFVAPDTTAGARTRTGALPVRLGAAGVVEVVLPELSVVERVALENAMML